MNQSLFANAADGNNSNLLHTVLCLPPSSSLPIASRTEGHVMYLKLPREISWHILQIGLVQNLVTYIQWGSDNVDVYSNNFMECLTPQH